MLSSILYLLERNTALTVISGSVFLVFGLIAAWFLYHKSYANRVRQGKDRRDYLHSKVNSLNVQKRELKKRLEYLEANDAGDRGASSADNCLSIDEQIEEIEMTQPVDVAAEAPVQEEVLAVVGSMETGETFETVTYTAPGNNGFTESGGSSPFDAVESESESPFSEVSATETSSVSVDAEAAESPFAPVTENQGIESEVFSPIEAPGNVEQNLEFIGNDENYEPEATAPAEQDVVEKQDESAISAEEIERKRNQLILDLGSDLVPPLEEEHLEEDEAVPREVVLEKESEITRLHGKLVYLKSSIQAKESHVSELESRFGSLKSKAQKLKHFAKRKVSDVEALKDEMSEATQSYRNRIVSLEENLAAQKDENVSLRKRFADLETREGAARESVETAENTIVEQQKAFEKEFIAVNEELDIAVSSASKKDAELSSKFANLEASSRDREADLLEKLATLQNETNELRASHEKETNELRASHEKETNELRASHEKEVAGLRKEAEQANASREQTEARTKADLAKAQEGLVGANRHIEEMKETFQKQLEAATRHAKMDVLAKNEEVERVNEQLARFSQEVFKQEKEIERLNSVAGDSQYQTQKFDALMATLNSKNQALDAKQKEIELLFSERDFLLGQKDREIKSLQARVREMEQRWKAEHASAVS